MIEWLNQRADRLQGRTYIFLFFIGISIITSQTSDSLNKSEIFSKTTHNTVYKGNFIIDFPKEAGEGELIYFRILHRENPSEYIYNFNFGDGTRRANSDGVESHIYKGQGNINKDLGLTGMDISISMFTKDGVAVNSFEQFLPVENRPPVISIPDDFPIEGLEGSKLEFSVDASDPG